VALSPHLDDAVLSAGAFLHRLARRGFSVRVLTVLANDPAATGPAGAWDAACGFRSAGDAARGRRREDERACTALGVRAEWLPFGDETYGRGADDEEVWRSVRASTEACDVLLVPGFPLSRPDHAWLAGLVLARHGELDSAIGVYAEQPYAAGELAAASGRRADGSVPAGAFVRGLARPEWRPEHPFAAVAGTPAFRRVRSTRADRRAKLRAAWHYRSQLRPLGPAVLAGASLWERVHGGELLALPSLLTD
jgi:LmbE family N-acetylglucosaminyl deacetylase